MARATGAVTATAVELADDEIQTVIVLIMKINLKF
jgi:hypothetical protein